MEARESGIHFETSKSGESTCSFQGKYFHSKYNPSTEGERFAENLKADFSPLCIFVLEPALSYCAPFIKKRFPNAELCAIRFSHDFFEYDSAWNHVFFLEGSPVPLNEQLFSTLGEEKLCASLSFDWTPSKQAFPAQSELAWQEIKKSILKARDVIATRAFFSKRWLKNSLIFASRVTNAALAEKGSEPIIVAASGPSLESSLPFIARNRNRFFLIALSSSYLPLSRHGIAADMVISSDGGYWAKKHLDFPQKKEAVFALEAEGSAPKSLLEKETVLPLVYEGGLEVDFLNAIGCPFMISERNGTVAGTALSFAYTLTSGNVYLCGLDQAPSPAFQHTQPNALESDNAKKDFRLKPAETRIMESRFNSSAVLEIYRNWFVSNSPHFSTRVFRLSDKHHYDFSLGSIRDLHWDDFLRIESGKTYKKITFMKRNIATEKSGRKAKLLETLKKLSETQKFIEEVFPMDTVLIKRELSPEKRRESQASLGEKITKLLKECEKII